MNARLAHGAVALAVACYGGLVLAGVLSRPDCPFATHLHVLCPMCGTTRAVLAFLSGDVAGAVRWNALFPVWGAACVLAYVDVLRRVAGKTDAGPCERGFRALAARPALLRTVQVALVAQTVWANTVMRDALLAGE